MRERREERRYYIIKLIINLSKVKEIKLIVPALDVF